MWTIHPVAECRLGKGREPVKKHTSKGKNQKGFALKAYQALMEDDEDKEASNDEAEQSEGEGSHGSNTSE
jgi:protein tyrosine/serine phosphatase